MMQSILKHCTFLAGTVGPGVDPAAGLDIDTTPYAGFWIRAAALAIDACMLLVLFGLVAVVLGDPENLVFSLVAAVVQWIYFAGFESSERQATPGKSALDLQVTDADGFRLSFGRATGRYFAKILSFMPVCLGFVIAAFTPRKQALHDLLAQTTVQRRE